MTPLTTSGCGLRPWKSGWGFEWFRVRGFIGFRDSWKPKALGPWSTAVGLGASTLVVARFRGFEA